MKHRIAILFIVVLVATSLSAQATMGNRQKMIAMILGQSHVKANTENYNRATGIYTITPAAQPASQAFRPSGTIPHYSLAKGAVICRLEEYVQLHSPFKLNIGLGGE